MKYVDILITFLEIPDEITLCINISGCPNKCPECHSKYLWDNIGYNLTGVSLLELMNKNQGITAICFMGGDQAPNEIVELAKCVKYNSDLLVGWYSGKEEIAKEVLNNLKYFDFIKIGPYDSKYGPIDNKNTNQIFYKVEKDNTLVNITYKFWK